MTTAVVPVPTAVPSVPNQSREERSVPDRSTHFATFTVERDIALAQASVFRAFADLGATPATTGAAR